MEGKVPEFSLPPAKAVCKSASTWSKSGVGYVTGLVAWSKLGEGICVLNSDLFVSLCDLGVNVPGLSADCCDLALLSLEVLVVW